MTFVKWATFLNRWSDRGTAGSESLGRSPSAQRTKKDRAVALFAHHHKLRWLAVTDFIAPLVPLGLAAGRIGNFAEKRLSKYTFSHT